MSDLRDRIKRTFQRCESCGGYYVNVSTHSCGKASTSDPRREERVRLAGADTRPDDERVAVLPTRSVDGSYAYHELDDDGGPTCGGGGALDDDEWVVLTRREAKDRGKAPCRTCQRIAR